MSGPLVTLLLGKPVRSDSVFPAVIERLEAASATVRVHVPDGGEPLPEWVFESRLVVQRGLGPAGLKAARALEEAGVPCCNPADATLAVSDRLVMTRALEAAGLPVPDTRAVGSWGDVVEASRGRAVVVKAVDGRVGRGRGVLLADSEAWPASAPFAGPYIVQERVQHAGHDCKLYVAGQQVRGLLKGATLGATRDVGEPFVVDAELADLALRAGAALGLEVFGVDVLRGAGGPVIVDVNPFPGFRGVTGAARLLADYMEMRVARNDVEVLSGNRLGGQHDT